MKARVLIPRIFICLLVAGTIPIEAPKSLTNEHQAIKQRVLKAYGRLPLRFEANQGQTDGQVKFLSRGSGYTLFLTANEAVLALQRTRAKSKIEDQKARIKDNEGPPVAPAVLHMKVLGSDPAPEVTGAEELAGKVNYFRGNDPKKWHTSIPTYRKVAYRQVYPGIDLIYHGSRRQLEYDFVVTPGADPKAIRLGFQGADTLRIDAEGSLILHVAGTEVIQQRPIAFQEINGARQEISCRYALLGRQQAGFQLGAYDDSRPLFIDPTLAFSTYLGGNNADNGNGIAVDASGNAYVTGDTASVNFPTTPGAFQTTCGGCPAETDAFVTKLDPTGSTLIFSTYLGGTDSDEGLAIAVDSSGSAYLTGETFSTDFPLMNPAQPTFGGGTCGIPPDTFPCPDAFVTKLNPTGSSLVYSTYVGGSQADIGFGIAVDSSGSAYVSGSTASINFPTTPGAFQPTFGGGTCGISPNTFPCPDAFVTKLDPTGSTLVYSTYLGGSNADEALSIALDASGNAYVTGDTASTNFPTTPGAFQTAYGGGSCGGVPCPEAFVTKLDPTGVTQVYSTYLGGDNEDGGAGIALDGSGNAYVTGSTSSANFPTTPGAFQTTLGGGICGIPPDTFVCRDAFVTKLNAMGSGLAYSSYLGGNDDDHGKGIALDTSGNAYLTGLTASTNFPLMNPLQGTYGGGPSDAFVTELNAGGSGLVASTYLGGSNKDEGAGIALDGFANAYVTGNTNSPDFPTTPGAIQTTFGGGTCGTVPVPCRDAFVAKVSP